jgi:aryl-alcohol dehydrogenase-like predicted oxidoreductase
MQYVRFGNTGMKVSRICLGCMSFGDARGWMLELDHARPILQKALDLGITFFDTANVYSRGRSEEITGEVLKEYRDDLIIATKVHGVMGEGPNDRGQSRVHILKQIEGSLKRLQTDYVDLYQIHRFDYDTPIEETLRTLDGLVQHGKVRYIGASSMYAWQFSKMLWTSERLGLERFVSMQNHYNLCYREEEREMIPLCQDQCIALIPWSPLARGFLSGKYKRDQEPTSVRYRSETELMKNRFFRPEDFTIVERVEELAAEKGVKPAQMALAWLFQKPHITAPILGATRVEHVEEAVEALEVKLSSSEMKQLEESYKPREISGHS